VSWFVFAALCFAGLVLLAGIGLFLAIVDKGDGPPEPPHGNP
jgi:hypothetical protein